MSFSSGVNSIVSSVNDFVATAVQAATSINSQAQNVVEDTSVTSALAGEVNDVNAGLDTFYSTSTQAKETAQQADADKQQGETDKLSAQARIMAADAKIVAANMSINSWQTQLEYYQDLQAQQNASSSEQTGTKDETKQDYSAQIAEAQNQLKAAKQLKQEAEAEKAQAEAELNKAEDDIQKAEATGQDAQSAGQQSADGGTSTGQQAESTAQQAQQAIQQAQQQAQAESAAQQAETPKAETPVAETVTTEPEGGETPTQEPQQTEPPKAETQTTEPPKAETQTTEPPKAETQQTEPPVAQTPTTTTDDKTSTQLGNSDITTNTQTGESVDITQETSDSAPEAVQERIENNEETDAEMAEVIINDMFEGESLEIGTEEIIGMAAHDAVEVASETFKTKLYSNTVYSPAVSTSTDTTTVEENQDAISNFMEAYSVTSDKINAPNVEFLSLTDRSNYENAARIQERLNNGEYILTREIEKNTTMVQSIQVSTDETANQKEEESKTKGQDLLRQLEAVITTDEDAKEDKFDDILTQNEYDDIDNFFNNTDDVASYYKEMVEEAKKYGIYTDANLIAA